MVALARRNLLGDRPRLFISVGGVALAVVLVLLLQGFQAGMFRQMTAYVDNTPASLWVGQKGVANFQGATSFIPVALRADVAQVEGVAAAIPILAQYSVLELEGEKVTTFLVGYDPVRGGGPWRLSQGRQVHTPDEAVVDRVLAERYGLSLGGAVTILGRSFRIVGLSEETTSWMLSMIFLHHDAAAALLGATGATSFILVRTDPGIAAAALASRLEDAVPAANVVTRELVAANDIAYIGGIFNAPLRMMVLISVGIGALLVGLTIYSATAERVREYGVLKALCMRNRTLHAVVLKQALGATALGFGLGVGLVRLVAEGIEGAWPQFLIVFENGSLVLAAGGGLAMALLAAYVPARYAGSIDPARVFRR